MITGGCHCGAIRYQAEGEAITHALCHCTDCRRHAGAPMVGWTMYAQDAVKVTKGTPKVYASSEHARRHFCADCGTGLFYANTQMLPGIIDIQSATYDDPDSVPARAHIQVAERIGWMARAHELPAVRTLPAARVILGIQRRQKSRPAKGGFVCDGLGEGYLAAWIMISTLSAGLASLASTVARAGVLPGATQASHTSFIWPQVPMSVSQMLADRIFDLSVPASFEELVDLVEDLLGLALDVGLGVVGGEAGEIDRVAMDHRARHAGTGVDALDAHVSLLLLKPQNGGDLRADSIEVKLRKPHPEEPRSGVSKGGNQLCCCPPFETRTACAPQGEVT